jgi:hypothetical protein
MTLNFSRFDFRLPVTIAFIVIAFVFMLRECDGPEDKPADVVTVTVFDTIWDTTRIETVVEKPVPVIVIDSIPVNTVVDTAMILAEFYKFRHYDTLVKDDSLAKLFVAADVWKNELSKLRIHGDVFNKTVTVTKTVIKPIEPRNKLYVGLLVRSDLNLPAVMVTGVGPGVLFQTKKDHLYAAQYDPMNGQFYFSTWLKIRLKK